MEKIIDTLFTIIGIMLVIPFTILIFICERLYYGYLWLKEHI